MAAGDESPRAAAQPFSSGPIIITTARKDTVIYKVAAKVHTRP